MFSTHRQHFATFALLVTASLPAQDLTVQVQQDPAANLAIYTAQVTAPPGSSFFLFASLGTLPQPLHFPSIVNGLELDPARGLLQLLGPVPVLPTGGVAQFTLPLAPLANLEIPMQALVIDPAQTLALSSLATAVQGGNNAPAGKRLNWAGGYDKRNGRYCMTFLNAPRGAQIEMKVNGGQKAVARQIAPGGPFTLYMNVNLARGDSIEIYCDGVLVKSWLWC